MSKSQDLLQEVAKKVFADRDALTSFYDVRMLFAAYCEVVSGLAAAMIKNNIYSEEVMVNLLAHMIQDAVTRECKTECKRVHGDEAIVGSKQ